MPNPIFNFYREDLLQVFKSYVAGIVDFYDQYKVDATPTTAECKSTMQIFTALSELHSEAVLLAASGQIQKYLNYYDIQPNGGVDEFKLVYFVGMALYHRMNHEEHTQIAKVVQYGMVLQLNECLKEATQTPGRLKLLAILKRLITDGLVEKRLGMHGIYLIFKCATNVVTENRKLLATPPLAEPQQH